MLTLLASALTSFVAISAFAQENQSNDNPCHSMQEILPRLECYDEQTGFSSSDEETNGSSASTEGDIASRSNDWILRENEDPVRGTDTSFVYLNADETNGRDAPQYFLISCDGKGANIISLETEGYIGNRNNRVPLIYKWSDREPISERWIGYVNGKGAALPDGYRDFRAGLSEGGRLAVEWTAYNGATYSAVWNNVQLDAKAEWALNNCKGKRN